MVAMTQPPKQDGTVLKRLWYSVWPTVAIASASVTYYSFDYFRVIPSVYDRCPQSARNHHWPSSLFCHNLSLEELRKK